MKKYLILGDACFFFLEKESITIFFLFFLICDQGLILVTYKAYVKKMKYDKEFATF